MNDVDALVEAFDVGDSGFIADPYPVLGQLREATPWGIGPRYLIRDNDSKFGSQFIATAEGAGISVTNVLTSPIGGVSRGNKHLVVQGVDDGHGWSLVLHEETGYMTASTVGDEEGMMIYGACTQP